MSMAQIVAAQNISAHNMQMIYMEQSILIKYVA